MKKASNYAFLDRKSKASQQNKAPNINGFGGLILPSTEKQDLNIFVVTFDGMKNSEHNLAGGDPYQCKKCKAILNKYSKVYSAKQYQSHPEISNLVKIQLSEEQYFWQCQFCLYPNILQIQKQQIPKKDDVFYMLESAHQSQITDKDSTIVFCIDTSGSMNTTSQIQGKVDLKFGISQEEMNMLRQFMQPGDEAQFDYFGNQKTYISRKQCILSAIENQLQQIKKKDPNKKVGFITFNNQVTVLSDGKNQTVNILGDKLYVKQEIINSLNNFKLTASLQESYQSLINNLNKTQAKGQTALGPALISAIQIASKGSPGSMVILCTDGLANIGIGSLDPFEQLQAKFYEQLSQIAKSKNIMVNLITIKGQSAKMQIIGKLAKNTNGNIKVVNPQKLKDDFANVLKDEVVGLNVQAKIMLHKSMIFRNQNEQFLKDNKRILVKEFANATVNTRISFQYELREEQDLKFMQIDIEKLKTVPFQAQIIYRSPKGGKYLRVISSQSKTTTQKQEAKKQVSIGVVHQRIASNTAAMVGSKNFVQAQQYNAQWSNYINSQFTQAKYQNQQQVFNSKNRRLNQAIYKKSQKQKIPQKSSFNQDLFMIKQQNTGNIIPQTFPLNSNYPKQILRQQKMSLSQLSSVSSDFDEEKSELRYKKPIAKKSKKIEKKIEQKIQLQCDMNSDQQQQQLMQNMMEKQGFDLD